MRSEPSAPSGAGKTAPWAVARGGQVEFLPRFGSGDACRPPEEAGGRGGIPPGTCGFCSARRRGRGAHGCGVWCGVPGLRLGRSTPGGEPHASPLG